MDAFLYLGHLREETDGDGQGEAEGQQAHKAVDGQHQPAVPLQEFQPEGVKKEGMKEERVNLPCESVPEDDCDLFLDAVKSIVFRFQGSCFVQLVGGRRGLNLWESSGLRRHKCCLL